MENRQPTTQSIAAALDASDSRVAKILIQMESHGLLERKEGEICLTPVGHDYALRIIRAHRLWEKYLADETGFKELDWHDQAEIYEHELSDEDVENLAASLGNPTHDPHGDPIPTSTGDFIPHGGKPLTSIPMDHIARIVHIEDEPEAIYAQLVAEGLYPGMYVRVVEISAHSIRFWAHGNEHVLAPILAANISVVVQEEDEAHHFPMGVKLSDLQAGESGRVVGLSPGLRGLERRRMMDLGIIPGTEINVEMRSPSGDPTAYRIRGAVIALRSEQSRFIYMEPFEAGEGSEHPKLHKEAS
jgi:DtxR family Mn-dependent transcriptional regulator